MSMSVPHIWASEIDPHWMMARQAGWRRSDLAWEQLQEKGNDHFNSGDADAAVRAWRKAGWIALFCFRRSDPRRSTTLANLALADRLSGREARARRRYARARRVWHGVDVFIADMQIARRARSSLFHLRMEARHWDTYQNNIRTRMTAFASETAEALRALEHGKQPECRLYGRWRAEKPAVFDDTRKLLAAALMIGAGETRHPEIKHVDGTTLSAAKSKEK